MIKWGGVDNARKKMETWTMEYKSVLVWSDSSVMGNVNEEHVTKRVQPVLNEMVTQGWRLHSQSAVWAQLVGIHLIFEKS